MGVLKTIKVQGLIMGLIMFEAGFHYSLNEDMG